MSTNMYIDKRITVVSGTDHNTLSCTVETDDPTATFKIEAGGCSIHLEMSLSDLQGFLTGMSTAVKGVL